jgi:hypothetical protein
MREALGGTWNRKENASNGDARKRLSTTSNEVFLPGEELEKV